MLYAADNQIFSVCINKINVKNCKRMKTKQEELEITINLPTACVQEPPASES